MIRKISLQNFQSHKNTEIDLHPGVNVIIGSSDSGKSAVIRAINWVVKNRPAGTAFCSTWGGETSCTIETNEGSVRRHRKGADGGYLLRNDVVENIGGAVGVSSTPLSFKAVGTDVPEEVKSFLQFDDELNIQYQHDAPFGLSFTSGDMARLLNRIVKIDKIDVALSNIDSMKRKNKVREQAVSDLLQKKTQQLTTFVGIEEIDKELQFLEKAEKEIEEHTAEMEFLASLIEIIEETKIKNKELKYNEGDDARLSEIEGDISILNTKKSMADDLYNLVELIEQTEEKKERLAKELEEKEEEFHSLMPEVCPLCGQKVGNK